MLIVRVHESRQVIYLCGGEGRMAKTNMICPFSGELCVECPQYRGRHYYLCFAKKYRGYLGEKKDNSIQAKLHSEPDETHRITADYRLPIPPPLKPSPTWLAFNDYPERKDK
jgi:hypothetical protein